MTNSYRHLLFDSSADRWFYESIVIPAVLKRDNYQCASCKSKKNLDVSHTKYGPDITINDLETLCRKCHKAKDKSNNIYLTKQD